MNIPSKIDGFSFLSYGCPICLLVKVIFEGEQKSKLAMPGLAFLHSCIQATVRADMV